MNNSVFGKTMENVRNHRDIKLVTSDKRRKRLVSEPNYHSHKKIWDHLMAIEMKKTVKMTKPLYLGTSVLNISKTFMYEFWYDYIIPKYEKLQWNSVTAINIKIINFDDYVNENKNVHNKNWPYIPDHPYRILIIGGSGSGKTNVLLNLIEN